MIDVIIPVCNMVEESFEDRIETLNFSLEHFYAKQQLTNIRVIIVEQSLDGKLFPYLNRIKCPEGLDIKFIDIHNETFNKQWCTNCGVKKSDREYIAIAECDMFSMNDKYFGEAMLHMEQRDLQWAFGWNKLYYTEKEDKVAIIKGEDIDWDKRKHVEPKRGYSEGGIVFYKREFFNDFGMANEFVKGLGGPDNELSSRAEFVSKTYASVPQTVIHLWHTTKNKTQMGHRKNNQTIIGISRRNTKKVNEYLTSLNMGYIKVPVCDTNKEEGSFIFNV